MSDFTELNDLTNDFKELNDLTSDFKENKLSTVYV